MIRHLSLGSHLGKGKPNFQPLEEETEGRVSSFTPDVNNNPCRSWQIQKATEADLLENAMEMNDAPAFDVYHISSYVLKQCVSLQPEMLPDRILYAGKGTRKVLIW